MNTDKMRRQQARNTPDAVWLTLNLYDDNATAIFEDWRSRWIRMMEIKHRKKTLTLHVYETQLLDQPGFVRIQLVALEDKRGLS